MTYSDVEHAFKVAVEIVSTARLRRFLREPRGLRRKGIVARRAKGLVWSELCARKRRRA